MLPINMGPFFNFFGINFDELSRYYEFFLVRYLCLCILINILELCCGILLNYLETWIFALMFASGETQMKAKDCMREESTIIQKYKITLKKKFLFNVMLWNRKERIIPLSSNLKIKQKLWKKWSQNNQIWDDFVRKR